MKKPTKIIIQESGDGLVCRAGVIPNSLFNFYVEKKRDYKDGTSRYDIGVELASNPKKAWRLASVRGYRITAEKRLDEILRKGI